ncbi:MAG: NAD(P)/FAD-dependent oxidoreductase [Haliea sp.]|jgi:sulfide dehydrogenase [flavocytochrome c] flavoprotein chain|nr:NAD(P)/FAD-dependent oxidoreductase [Haliea sp.]
MTFTRRNVLKVVAATASMAASGLAVSASQHRVVVVGGGFGGGTVARYLARWGGADVAVTLVDPGDAHVSCVMSGLVLNDSLSLSDLTFPFAGWKSRYGIDHLQRRALSIDGAAKRLALDDGSGVDYDSLVLSPGIRFIDVPGLNSELIPHGWIAGPQTQLLHDQIRDMPDAGTFILSIPKSPYRCPPGPYERACLVADILGRRSGALGVSLAPGRTPKVIVLDANPRIQAEEETFSRAFSELYGNIVSYHANAELLSVDSTARVVETSIGSFSGDVVNVIPGHAAPQLLADSGLTDGGLWAPIDPVTYASTVAGFPGVHVIGDAQASGQPKSGHMANSQAKICADAILRNARGLQNHTAERLAALTTNSACFSPITANEASWLTAVYRYDTGSGQMALVPASFGASRGWSKSNYERMFDWSNNLLADTFL